MSSPEVAPYAAGALAAGAVLCLVLSLRAWSISAALEGRLLEFVGRWAWGWEAVGRVTDRPSFRERAVAPLVTRLGRMVDNALPDRQVQQIRSNLAMAGLPSRRHLSQFLAAKAAVAVGLAVLTVLFTWRTGGSVPRVLFVAVVAALLGFYLPSIWLGRRMAQRRLGVLRALPDALDLLTISVSAGLGFDGALLEVVQRWRNPLTIEFATVLRDLKLGRDRRDALRDFAARTGVTEITHLVAALIQADELGAPIKDALRVQAEQIRQQRRHRAEENARKAAVKVIIPMVLFIFPALFVILLGPSIPAVQATFK